MWLPLQGPRRLTAACRALRVRDWYRPSSGQGGYAQYQGAGRAAARHRGRLTMRDMRTAVVATATALAVATGAFALMRPLSLSYQWQAENLALETAASLIALLACFLVFGPLHRRTRLNELMLAWGSRYFRCPT